MKKKLIAGFTLLSVSSFILATSLTFSWFDNRIKFTPDIEGSAIGAYFNQYDSGTSGTWGESSSNPYVISTARQLYNLSWLQYLGKFNKATSDTDSTLVTYYFEIDKNLTYDLDMSGWVIPSIGDTTHPFIGNFNGNSKVISNLTISNDFSEFNAHPYSVTSSNYTSSSIIGLFGVVGQYEDTSISYDASLNKITNVYVDSLTVQNGTSTNVLAGFLAGYVNASIQYCGVGYAHFDFKSGTTNISSLSENVSNYTLIGYYNSDDYTWTDRPGDSTGFGGSIDITSLSKRVTYITKADGITKDETSSSYTYDSDVYNSHFYTTTKSAVKDRGYDWTSFGTTQTVTFEESTLLPLNIDLTTANIINNETNTNTYYDGKTPEPVLSSNTGYIVGNSATGNTSVRLMHKKSDKSSSGIVNSIITQLNGTDSTDSNEMFASSNYSLFYFDSSTKTNYRISDSDNPENYSKYDDNKMDSSVFSKYDTVKTQFIEMLRSSVTDTYLTTNGKIELNGILLRKGNASSVSFKEFNNITINRTTYNTYKMAEGGINYSLNKAGILTLVCGTYSSSSSNHTFYNFYEIDRSNSASPTSKKIYKIYQNSSNDIKYTYDSSSTITDTGYNLVCDLGAMNDSPYLYANCAYYMEIPFKVGDYFISNIGADGSNSPYILYLDIGANATSTEEDKEIKDVDFVYQEDSKLVAITDDNWDSYKSDVLFSISGTESGDGLYYFRRVKDVGVLYYVSTANMTITSIGSGTIGTGKDKNCSETTSS